MYRVLMAVDGDDGRLDAQLRTLGDLPGRDELAVTVLYVHEEIDVPADEAGRSIIDAINEDIESLQGVPETVGRAVSELEALDVPTDSATARGDPVPSILDAAAELDADAILVAARTRSPVGKAVFGSVTQGVILDGDRPVFVAK
ncbi:universal stress protein [Haloprofundus salinisoli]|uniref:universal stress protein n=1 Tax=Haloprofundus salinisoli TaxID=2876193 RepID=UPI001CCCAF2F|nr:universal stress protein [Haloprofundus salinisoli]